MKPWKMKSFVAVLGSVADDRRWQENSSKYVMKTAHKTEGSSLIETVSPSTSSWVHQDMRKGAIEGISFHGAIIPLFSVLWACILWYLFFNSHLREKYYSVFQYPCNAHVGIYYTKVIWHA